MRFSFGVMLLQNILESNLGDIPYVTLTKGVATGALEPLFGELGNNDDLLGQLAGLQQLLELTQQATVPAEVQAHVVPHIMKLLENSADPALQHAALAAAGTLLRRGMDLQAVGLLIKRLSAVLEVRTA
jgi:hypothetical protein